MRVSRDFFASIRFKIYVLYVISLFLTLGFFNFLIYLNYKETLDRKIDSLLDAKVQAVESAVRTYWEAQVKVEATEPKKEWYEELFGRAQKKAPAPQPPTDPYEIILRYLTDDMLSPHPNDVRIYIDVFDTKGHLVDSSHSDHSPALLDKNILNRVLDGQKVFYGYVLQSRKGTGVPVRAFAKAIKVNDQTKDIVRARVFMTLVDYELHELIVKLFIRSIIVILLASWGSFFLVKATLRPVSEMIRTIRSIKHDNLDRRIQVPRTGDEIASLAETFNDVLEKLEKSFRAQTQIVQDISHELRTPLTIISGQIEVIVKKKRTTEEYEEMLYSSLEEIAKVRRIIDSLLMLARFDNPDYTLELKTLDLNALLEGVVQDIQVLGREKDLKVTFEQAPHIEVRANEVHLDRLFRNLLENAIKYNTPGGSIQVILEKIGKMAKITIKDSGIGIPSESTGKIFDRFYRVDQARSSGEGFGLGLSIAKSIVEAHRGRIIVESKEGKGTTFFVQLPLLLTIDNFLPA